MIELDKNKDIIILIIRSCRAFSMHLISGINRSKRKEHVARYRCHLLCEIFLLIRSHERLGTSKPDIECSQ
ncbi:alanine:glyoxylate aminotransferase 2 family protein [Paenibacillus amylolyticus]|uniref:Alanine:glyoxylate aminotransferase 2 family protein n=1 Tax=Paenibacillus amylolyticus TaxID=1451 RepID=A0A117I182_PAEAM|nr:alanine:glyoxylate aminotransferase 2 family protein [Paenibacillus amylolyticus]